MAKSLADQFTNKYAFNMTMSAVNTLTYQQIEFGVSLFDNVAILLHELDLTFSSTVIREMAANTDELFVGLVNSNTMAALSSSDPRIYWLWRMVGMGVNVEIQELPKRISFASFPGGGLLLPPRPLYVAMNTAGFAAPGSVTMTLLYTVKQMSQADYLELMQAVLNTAL